MGRKRRPSPNRLFVSVRLPTELVVTSSRLTFRIPSCVPVLVDDAAARYHGSKVAALRHWANDCCLGAGATASDTGVAPHR